jgi:recombination protein U
LNTFESELSLTFRIRGFHYFKRNIASTQEIPFLKAEGYDYVALYQGQYYGIEAKMCSNKVTSFPFDRVVEHQVEALLDCEREQGQGWVLINFRKHPNKPKNVSYGIRIKDFLDVKNSIGKKSINLKEIELDKRFIRFIKIKIDNKLVWDLSQIIQGKIHG